MSLVRGTFVPVACSCISITSARDRVAEDPSCGRWNRYIARKAHTMIVVAVKALLFGKSFFAERVFRSGDEFLVFYYPAGGRPYFGFHKLVQLGRICSVNC